MEQTTDINSTFYELLNQLYQYNPDDNFRQINHSLILKLLQFKQTLMELDLKNTIAKLQNSIHKDNLKLDILYQGTPNQNEKQYDIYQSLYRTMNVKQYISMFISCYETSLQLKYNPALLILNKVDKTE
jgi:hypothetical protein